MRLRNKTWAKPLIAEHPELILVRPEKMPGQWQSRFKQNQPLYLEVGSGKTNSLLRWRRLIQTAILLLWNYKRLLLP